MMGVVGAMVVFETASLEKSENKETVQQYMSLLQERTNESPDLRRLFFDELSKIVELSTSVLSMDFREIEKWADQLLSVYIAEDNCRCLPEDYEINFKLNKDDASSYIDFSLKSEISSGRYATSLSSGSCDSRYGDVLPPLFRFLRLLKSKRDPSLADFHTMLQLPIKYPKESILLRYDSLNPEKQKSLFRYLLQCASWIIELINAFCSSASMHQSRELDFQAFALLKHKVKIEAKAKDSCFDNFNRIDQSDFLLMLKDVVHNLLNYLADFKSYFINTLSSDEKRFDVEDDSLSRSFVCAKTIFDCITSNFHVWYDFMLTSLSEKAAEMTDKSQSFMSVQKVHLKHVLSSALHLSPKYVSAFTLNALPFFDRHFREFVDDFRPVFQAVQQSTRVNKDQNLTRHIPLCRRTIEQFIFRVKAMMVSNKCIDAVQIANLKTKNLYGEVISSQSAPAGTPERVELGASADDDGESKEDDQPPVSDEEPDEKLNEAR
ncbi:unnamed protein product [Soboliphyme baturini]|uniref:FANCI_S4 domain-containing protein n=1 Tax=Soboliphyme baturini TaxID=241478 RepID=A0A183IWE8_9BILA|nr:unnamed protein product [Soboliphyme baturini]